MCGWPPQVPGGNKQRDVLLCSVPCTTSSFLDCNCSNVRRRRFQEDTPEVQGLLAMKQPKPHVKWQLCRFGWDHGGLVLDPFPPITDALEAPSSKSHNLRHMRRLQYRWQNIKKQPYQRISDVRIDVDTYRRQIPQSSHFAAYLPPRTVGMALTPGNSGAYSKDSLVSRCTTCSYMQRAISVSDICARVVALISAPMSIPREYGHASWGKIVLSFLCGRCPQSQSRLSGGSLNTHRSRPGRFQGLIVIGVSAIEACPRHELGSCGPQ